ncbi:F0F1 ATP synthase subunit delta [Thermohalobacter berrensis]|uniref:ATP synthase subunit delta n=1 Tax=Thermohalobacter berrensis TaxID=99594 RepID=A0A419T259_9FIRM|nr:F0F1 ATP synthase subunit delta [Thermohalobacter berrensis]RKD31532.1 ATP synthase F1 subunit delta [Thermohalobacter berrensis]
MAKLVSKRYAEALFEVALEMDKLDNFKEEISDISNVFESEEKLKIVFEHPKLSKKEKKDIVDSIFKDRVSQEILNLLYIIIDKGRERYITEIKKEYIKLYNEEKNIVEAVAITAVPMAEEEKVKLQNRLSEKLNKNIVLKNKIDKKVIGGVLIKIGDKIIDSSIKGQLDNIAKKLKDTRVTKIGVSS